MEKPVCSVVIPAYNCQRFIGEAVNSALNQTESNLEIVIVNDFSTDNTAEVIKDLAAGDDRIVIIENTENLGVAEARNIGVAHAKSDLIAFLDADDYWVPQKLQKQIAYLRENDLDLTYCGYNFVDEQGQALDIAFNVSGHVTFKNLLKQCVINPSSSLIKREVLLSCPMEKSELLEDFICWLKILKTGVKASGLDERLTYYRLVKNSRSSNKLRVFVNAYRSLRYVGLNRVSAAYYTVVMTKNTVIKYKSYLFKR